MATINYVAFAVREYGEGRISIHTDKIGAYLTGHGINSKGFVRQLFEWSAGKKINESIKVGFVISVPGESISGLDRDIGITTQIVTIESLATKDLSGFDCLYFVGLPKTISSSISSKVEQFVVGGKGLIVESPNNSGENINVLADIEDLYCYSAKRASENNADWTVTGSEHSFLYRSDAEITFMVSLRESDFSSNWDILMSNVVNVFTTTTTTGSEQEFNFLWNAGFEFGISFSSYMQKGIVIVEEGLPLTSSSSSSSSSEGYSSSSSSSSSSG